MSYEAERSFAQKLSNTFLGTDKVKVSESTHHVAFANVANKQIWFDFCQIFGDPDTQIEDKEIFKAMMSFKGLLFHEIHHIKHTTNWKDINLKSRQTKAVAGWLEDGRIETLAVLKYDKLADYFNFAVNNYIIKNCKQDKLTKDATVFTFVLMYGRKLFLESIDFLKIIRKLMFGYYGKSFTIKVEGIVEKYVYEADAKKRTDLAQELADMLFKENVSTDNNSGYDFGNNSEVFRPAHAPKNTAQDLKEMLEDMKQAKEISIQIATGLCQEDSQVKDDTKSKDVFDKKKQNAIAKIDKKLKKVNETKDKLWKGYYDEPDEKKRDKVQKKLNKENEKEKEIDQKKIQEKNKEYQADPELVGQILTQGHENGGIAKTIEELGEQTERLLDKQIPDLVSDIKSIGRSLDNVYSDTTFTVTNHMKEVKKKIDKGLKNLSNELVKGYVSGMRTGKVNVKRFINRKSMVDTKVFRKYMPDRIKQTKLLINLYVDGSGSMRQKWNKALSTLWIINEAMNTDENKVMCYEFSTDFLKFKDYDSILTIPKFLGDGTDPRHAILDSIPIIERYKRKNGFKHVIDIIITDGRFSRRDNSRRDNNEAIAKLNKLGHETVLINVEYMSSDSHNAKHVMCVDSFNDLAEKLIQMFKVIKKNVIRQARMM